MSTLVVVASKHGTTAEVGRRIAQHLGEGTVVHDLADGAPDLCGVDTVVLGTAIYAGMPMKAMKQYAAAADFDCRKVALFAVGMLPDADKRAEQLANAYPAALRERAVAATFLPGRFLMDRLSAFERFTIKWVAKSKQDVDAIDDEAIASFAKAVNAVTA